jgi:hypothetical protein
MLLCVSLLIAPRGGFILGGSAVLDGSAVGELQLMAGEQKDKFSHYQH